MNKKFITIEATQTGTEDIEIDPSTLMNKTKEQILSDISDFYHQANGYILSDRHLDILYTQSILPLLRQLKIDIIKTI